MDDEKRQLWLYKVIAVKDGIQTERKIRAHHHVLMGQDDTSIMFYLDGQNDIAQAHGVVWWQREKVVEES